MQQTLKERLEEVMQAKGWAYADLVRESGESRSVVSQWLGHGSKLIKSIGKMEAAERLEAASGYSALWIAKGGGPKMATSPPHRPTAIKLENNPDYPAVKRVQFKLSAGVSGYAVEYIDDDGPPIVFRKDWFKAHGYRAEKLLAARVNGASMEPTLYDSDLVVINTAQAEPIDGHAFALNYEGVMTIKRLVRDGGEWWLRSDNPDKIRFPDKRTHAEVSIIGEIVYRQSERI